MNKDIVASAALAAPGYVATGSWFAGFDLPHFVMVLTAISLVLSIAHTIVKWNRK
ncbi:hypothetical protein [Paraburkholderia sartisoli]|uniref:Holin n=1 Tax=Paraburkholderia sartisoli TaxID=83784 RepID=A0A1H4HT13_9BURK|nr:hypothetical protein [Paraburkholderia sartisoli]SEB24811.1 hypothetical protein SAMN05192564_11547 [Paraburkholderia sartisoli]